MFSIKIHFDNVFAWINVNSDQFRLKKCLKSLWFLLDDRVYKFNACQDHVDIHDSWFKIHVDNQCKIVSRNDGPTYFLYDFLKLFWKCFSNFWFFKK